MNGVPKRIISLVPSQTELLWDLGLRDELVGITKFCIHPKEMFQSKTRIGGTKKLDFEKIKALQPDLIIGNKEENEQAQIEELMKHYPVWMSDINTLNDAYKMITDIGSIVNKQNASEKIVLQIKSEFNSILNSKSKILNQKSTAYFIWKKPYMVASEDTFINEMMITCGFKNVFQNKTRYPEVTLEELQQLQPEVILLSSEPYPFKEKHIKEFKTACPNAKIIIVDGELFSWYGSRLVKSPKYFTKLIQQIEG